MNEHIPGRRHFLRGAVAAASASSLYGCSSAEKKREPLVVGGLPVTCNLTLPVACVAKDASIKAGKAATTSHSSTTSFPAGRRSRNR